MTKQRIISANAASVNEDQMNLSLRPTSLEDYVGQPKLVERLSIALQAVKQRGESMEHVLLHGPPGLGKTTLAYIIAKVMGTLMSVSAGPALTKTGDLVGILTNLQHGDVLFIDEIHRLPIALEEYLYSAMEDFKIDVQVDSGMHAKTYTLPLKPFCLIGATTRAGLVSGPMRSRFGLIHNIEFYGEADLLKILHRSAALLGMIDSAFADSQSVQKSLAPLRTIARRSRGTPRIANRLLRRVRDFAQVRANGELTEEVVESSLRLEGVDELGLDELDHKYLRVLADIYQGGPVGLEAIAATMGEDGGTLEDVAEPYLLQIGFVARTRRGRQLTQSGAGHLGLTLPEKTESESLF